MIAILTDSGEFGLFLSLYNMTEKKCAEGYLTNEVVLIQQKLRNSRIIAITALIRFIFNSIQSAPKCIMLVDAFLCSDALTEQGGRNRFNKDEFTLRLYAHLKR